MPVLQANRHDLRAERRRRFRPAISHPQGRNRLRSGHPLRGVKKGRHNLVERIYVTNPTFDFTGSVSGGTRVDGGVATVPAGFNYVLAKYDGPNGGAVLFHLAGQAYTLPADSAGLWVNTAGQGYGLSNFTGYGSVSVPDGGATLTLLGLGLTGILWMSRRLALA